MRNLIVVAAVTKTISVHLAERSPLHPTNRADQREFWKAIQRARAKGSRCTRAVRKRKGPRSCELRALLVTRRRGHARGTAEGASDTIVGTLWPTTPARLDGKPNHLTSLARRDRNRFRSLSGRVTTATPVPGNWTSCMAGWPADMKAVWGRCSPKASRVLHRPCATSNVWAVKWWTQDDKHGRVLSFPSW